jgi:hypothetical protein
MANTPKSFTFRAVQVDTSTINVGSVPVQAGDYVWIKGASYPIQVVGVMGSVKNGTMSFWGVKKGPWRTLIPQVGVVSEMELFTSRPEFQGQEDQVGITREQLLKLLAG